MARSKRSRPYKDREPTEIGGEVTETRMLNYCPDSSRLRDTRPKIQGTYNRGG